MSDSDNRIQLSRTVYVRVLYENFRTEWITFRASDLHKASEEAKELDGVLGVLEASYIPGGVAT